MIIPQLTFHLSPRDNPSIPRQFPATGPSTTMISRAAAPSPSSIANLSSRSLRIQGSAARSFASVQDTTHPVRQHGGLRDQDRIFTNLYGHHGTDLKSAMKFGDWHRTKDIVLKGHDWVRFSFAATKDILWPCTRFAGLYWTLRLICCA